MRLNRFARVLVDHDPAVEYHEWVTLGDKFVWADRIGRPNTGAYHRWQKWQCNNSECPAEAIVSVRELEAVVEGWLPACPADSFDEAVSA